MLGSWESGPEATTVMLEWKGRIPRSYQTRPYVILLLVVGYCSKSHIVVTASQSRPALLIHTLPPTDNEPDPLVSFGPILINGFAVYTLSITNNQEHHRLSSNTH